MIKVEPIDSGRTQKSLNLVDVHYNLGLVYFDKGQYQKALEIWERTLARDPDNGILQERIAEAQACIRAGEESPAVGSAERTS